MTRPRLKCSLGRFSTRNHEFSIIIFVRKTIKRKRIFKINSKLLAESKTLQFRVNNISPEIEKQLNIGIFQFDDYIAFYINLTAYEQYLESQGSMNLIRISDSQYPMWKTVFWSLPKVLTDKIVFVISKYQLEELIRTMIPVNSQRTVELIWLSFHMKLNVGAAGLHLIRWLSIIIDSFSCALMRKS